MANAKVQGYLQGLKDEKETLLKAAQDAVMELNEVGAILGFSYSLHEDGAAKPKATPTGKQAPKTSLAERVKEAKRIMLDHLKANPKENTRKEIFLASGFPETSNQTYTKHLDALVEDGCLERTTRHGGTMNAHNPYVYSWVKDLDD